MAKYSFINPDSMFVVDGVGFEIPCSEMHNNIIHAIQFDTETSKGHVEFFSEDAANRMPNIQISSFDNYQFLVERWQEQREKKEKEEVAAKQAREAELEKRRKAKEEADNGGLSQVQQLKLERQNGSDTPSKA